MPPYIPNSSPTLNTLEDVRSWVDDELLAIAQASNSTRLLKMELSYRDVEKPRDGMIIFADGVSFDPGAGEGTYEWWGGAWHKLGGGVAGRTLLTSDTTFYVSTTGNDSNNGLTSGTAWLTLQHAFDTIGQNYDAGDNYITIQMADGTYDGAFLYFYPVSCPGLIVEGNGSDVTKVVINEWNGSTTCIFILVPNAFVQFDSITIKPTKSVGDFGIFISGDYCEVNVNDCAFVAHASGSSQCIFLSGNFCSLRFGYTFASGGSAPGSDVSVTGTWGNFIYITSQASYVRFVFGNFNLISTPQWTDGFITVDSDFFDGIGSTFTGSAGYNTIADLHTMTFVGGATGSRGRFNSPCFIEFGPVTPASLPGNSGPTFTSPGIYWSAIEGASFHSGEMLRTKAGLPVIGDIVRGGWGVFKDTSGGGVYVACNDGGVIKSVALI